MRDDIERRPVLAAHRQPLVNAVSAVSDLPIPTSAAPSPFQGCSTYKLRFDTKRRAGGWGVLFIP
jgi:hypothetical protein